MHTLSVYFRKDVFNIFFLGLGSGIPFALIGSTLANWLTKSGIDRTSIGILSSLMIFYSLKFLWSFILDTFSIPILTKKLGFRRSWILVLSIALCISIMMLGSFDPQNNLFAMALSGLLVGFISATLDIAIDAYRIEKVAQEYQAAAAATYIWGYRIAMLLSGGGALFLSEYLNWQQVYFIMSFFVLFALIPIFTLGESRVDHNMAEIHIEDSISDKFYKLIVLPFKELLSKNAALVIFVFIACFKLTDSFLGTMANTFYVEMGYTNKEIAVVIKAYGLIFTLLGTAIGGMMLVRLGYFWGLFISGILQGASNLFYLLLLNSNHDTNILTAVIAIENSTTALSSVMMVAFVSSLCSLQYSATHYALLSSLAMIGRSFLSMPSGYIVDQYGWVIFIISSTVIALPGLILLIYLNKRKVFATKQSNQPL
jgi:PAT family beta-lactamase induction signal transducer AmpG